MPVTKRSFKLTWTTHATRVPAQVSVRRPGHGVEGSLDKRDQRDSCNFTDRLDQLDQQISDWHVSYRRLRGEGWTGRGSAHDMIFHSAPIFVFAVRLLWLYRFINYVYKKHALILKVHNSIKLFDQGHGVLIELFLFDLHGSSHSADADRPLLSIQSQFH